MDRKDIIRMAREAGFGQDTDGCIYIADRDGDCNAEIERFAALVASAERSACTHIIETYRIPVGNSASGELACEWTYDALKEIRDTILARGGV